MSASPEPCGGNVVLPGNSVHAPWIMSDQAQTYPLLSRRQRQKCQHEWRYILGPTAGGWSHVCCKCGAKAR